MQETQGSIPGLGRSSGEGNGKSKNESERCAVLLSRDFKSQVNNLSHLFVPIVVIMEKSVVVVSS